MGWTVAQKNRQADQDATVAAYVSMHTADPGSTGASEASGGSYARKAPTWGSAGDEGALGASDQPASDGVAWAAPTFDLPAGTFTHFGFWSASSGGTFLGGFAVQSNIILASAASQQVSVYVSAEDAA